MVRMPPALVAPNARPEAPVLRLACSEQGLQAVRERIANELARELHDQVAQSLTGLLVQTDVFMREQHSRPDVVDQLAFVRTTVREVLNDLRQILCDLRGEPGLANSLMPAHMERHIPSYQF